MIDLGKKNILGIRIDAVDYEAAVERIFAAAHDRRSLAVTALAVHGVMTGVLDEEQKYRLNRLDMVVPDGQPVRWAINWLHSAALRQRVYGPRLTLEVCARAERERLPVFFYGSTEQHLRHLRRNLVARFPRLHIAGMEGSRFRRLNASEKQMVIDSIRRSDASLVFVGLGCPRQEVWLYEFTSELPMPLLAVGAAFSFIANLVPQAPNWMQEHGLEWLFRLATEPRRLWQRYLVLNPYYSLLVLMQWSGLRRFATDGLPPQHEILYG